MSTAKINLITSISVSFSEIGFRHTFELRTIFDNSQSYEGGNKPAIYLTLVHSKGKKCPVSIGKVIRMRGT